MVLFSINVISVWSRIYKPTLIILSDSIKVKSITIRSVSEFEAHLLVRELKSSLRLIKMSNSSPKNVEADI